MWRTLLRSSAVMVVQYTFSTFTGLEAFKGWVLNNPAEWIKPFAGWPLYSALTVFAVGMFIIASIILVGMLRDWADRQWRRQQNIRAAERDALVTVMQNIVRLFLGHEVNVSPMERLSLLDLKRQELDKLGLAAPAFMDDVQSVAHYHRLLPYLRVSIGRAQKEAASWIRERVDG